MRRIRIGPLAVDGSTTRPCCVILTSPEATSLRAAILAGSMRLRQAASDSVPPTTLAASEGQMVSPFRRCARSPWITASSSRSTGLILRFRHASEQYRTSSQFRSHFLRHSMVRPQESQVFSSESTEPTVEARAGTRLSDLAVLTRRDEQGTDPAIAEPTPSPERERVRASDRRLGSQRRSR